MLTIDPNDTRPQFSKVASSLRAAILTGEFKPGQQIPPGHELAKFFEVARETVRKAIGVLEQDGFVVSRTGSGVYVRDRPTAEADGTNHEFAGTIAFLHEIGFLKKVPRAGWFMAGVDRPESVAEHSFRTAVVGTILAALAGADTGRTALLCLLHDSPETRIGDIPSVGRAYVSTAKPEAVSQQQTATMPDALSTLIQGLVHDYEAEETVEARLAHDADKIEMLLQAREYEVQGRHNTEPWQNTSQSNLRTEQGRVLADATRGSDPERWWKAFAETHTELRRSARPRPDR
jgi:5'-deoxynucleotidase YfbR-like HD superfamily hydrolase